MERRTPLWLSHHWPEDYRRCVRLGRRHVCRRCLVVYPVWLGAGALALAGLRWPWAWDAWMLWLLPLPAAVEWWLEHLGRIEYSPPRSTAVSVLAAIGVGVAFTRYLERPADPLFWSIVVTYGIACTTGALVGHRHARRAAVRSPGERRGTAAARAR